MDLQSDKGRAAFAILITKIWQDEKLEKQFRDDPKTVLKKEGIDVPDDTDVQVLPNSDKFKYIVLPPEPNLEEAQDHLVALFSHILPIPEGTEVRFVQNTDKKKYIVVPPALSQEHMATMAVAKAMTLQAASGFEATFHETDQTVEVDVYYVLDWLVEVVVTETVANVLDSLVTVAAL